ncbi:GNAT family N-acetyltransferase [Methanolobus sp. WCC5]|uniref:GNAT family N-acetyltransferase n=1 Tax=Methanolobus sp. WCC5 TaxID=3125785 RepID=UPI003255C10A
MKMKWTAGYENFSDAYKVRKEVFVNEQKIDEELEIDEYDENALHLVIYKNLKPIATGRLFEQDGSFIIGRVCVLREYRSMQLGSLLMDSLIEKAISIGAKELYLSSQVAATGFYSRFGFFAYGDVYKDAGIDHISMVRRIR